MTSLTDRAGRRGRARPRPAVLALAFVQVALPVTLLAVRWAQEGSRPTTELPASWQMYTSVQPAAYSGTDAAGRHRELDVDGLPPVLRTADVGNMLPLRLCAVHPDVVVVQRRGGPDPRIVRC